MTRTFSTNLRCAACEAKLRPILNAEPAIRSWSVDLAKPEKPLTIEGNIDGDRVAELLAQAGYKALAVDPPREATDQSPTGSESAASKATYYPLALLVGLLAATALIAETSAGKFDAARAMENFMGGFFIAFAYFKLLDVRAFADAFATYDLLAAQSRAYALSYPFVELALGAAYLARAWPSAVNATTLALMLFGAAGVAKALAARRRIRCACLGTVFNLPMSTVTLVEDLGMAAMAAFMLFGGHR